MRANKEHKTKCESSPKPTEIELLMDNSGDTGLDFHALLADLLAK